MSPDLAKRLQAELDAATARYESRNSRSKALHEEAVKTLPGGNTRTVLHASPFPVVIKSGAGYQVTSEDGHTYTDFTGEFTAALYGHSNPVILSAIRDVLDNTGMNVGGTTRQEQIFARELCQRFKLEHVRFANSGTEANIHALAAARAFTKKRKVVTFGGGYHGAVLGFKGGKPEANNVDMDDWIMARYNDVESARNAIETEGVAAVLVEGMQGSGGGLPGQPEFLQGIQEAASKAGVLFILDEVMTSRLSAGGIAELRGLKPDLTTFGKYLGGGLAFGAFGGRADIMAAFDPRLPGALSHSGTFNNNTLVTHAGYAGLTKVYTPEVAAEFTRAGDNLREKLNEVTKGTRVVFTGLGTIMGVHFPKDGTRVFERSGEVEELDGLRDLFWLEMMEEGFWIVRRGFIAFVLETPASEFDSVSMHIGYIRTLIQYNRGPPLLELFATHHHLQSSASRHVLTTQRPQNIDRASQKMDFQNRAGSKFGGGGVASQSATNADRRERLRKLALETIDLDKDPYFFKNHVGSFECRLCLTVHQNDGSYLAHTQGKKHQTNLARRAAREQKEGRQGAVDPATGLPIGVTSAGFAQRRNVVKIGRPGYKITKIRDPVTRQQGLLFQLQYPDATPETTPKWQVMNAFTQHIEEPDKNFQYLLVAAEPYETVGFKIPARELDKREDKQFAFWDPDAKEYWIQVMFMTEREERFNAAPGLTARR
ncbi:hypothetical protein FZEAL_9737 [Fusarium zealandicum]|uniref:Matrin-type domain-containing protein n=1 Tax=Fusarium zealandicum TaxID=1053134 RepID=A0A8H4U8N3_9HYPO|nr:hypothetical protein FZEAL_9737 [Fusarium zealandicum]